LLTSGLGEEVPQAGVDINLNLPTALKVISSLHMEA